MARVRSVVSPSSDADSNEHCRGVAKGGGADIPLAPSLALPPVSKRTPSRCHARHLAHGSPPTLEPSDGGVPDEPNSTKETPMDSQRFDRLSSIFGEQHSRRAALRALAVATLGAGGLVALGREPTAAKKKRRKKGGSTPVPSPGGNPGGTPP